MIASGHEEQRESNSPAGGQHRVYHLKHSLMSHKKKTSVLIWHFKGHCCTPIDVTCVTLGADRCWGEWDQSPDCSRTCWSCMFKAIACLCLLSGLQQSALGKMVLVNSHDSLVLLRFTWLECWCKRWTAGQQWWWQLQPADEVMEDEQSGGHVRPFTHPIIINHIKQEETKKGVRSNLISLAWFKY